MALVGLVNGPIPGEVEMTGAFPSFSAFRITIAGC